jgi:eukaryotic-like serine/threonine-protein kinase
MAVVGTAPKQGGTPTHAIDVGDVVLERYRVVEQIASGGHSVVFRGQDERLSRPVCIKVFSGLGGQSGVGRTSYEHFVQEAFALSRLTHPNTLRIYDFGHLGPKDEAGMPLQVCEFMNGGTLSMIVREQGKQSLGETVRIMSAMCSALAEAHGLGIVHRDIKPQNILFASVGATKLPKLADFGIAKWSAETESQDDENRAEDTAIVAGQKLAMYSPSWAAPEQLAGQPVSPATDIYSLACVSVYMLSAKAIFADEDVYAGYKKRRHADELVKEALGPHGIPRSVVKLLGRALAFDPKQRVSRVEDLSAELAAALELPTEEQPRLKPPPPPRPGTAARVSQVTPVTPTEPVERVTPIGPTEAAPPEPAPHHTFVAPPAPVVQPWMMTAAAPSGMPYRLQLSDVPLQVGDRRVHFLMLLKSVGDLVGTHNMKVRVTLLPNPTGNRVVHLKGLTCFVSLLGGRPSPAVQLDKAGDIALVSPRGQEIGHLRVTTGTPGIGQSVFALGTEQVTIGLEDCADPILFDFGPGSDAYFVYTRGRTIPRPKGRG